MQEGGKMKQVDLGETKGIKRKLDNLGRVVLPKEFRESLKLNKNEEVEIYLLQEGIYIKKV